MAGIAHQNSRSCRTPHQSVQWFIQCSYFKGEVAGIAEEYELDYCPHVLRTKELIGSKWAPALNIIIGGHFLEAHAGEGLSDLGPHLQA